jgi:hypothetical protein
MMLETWMIKNELTDMELSKKIGVTHSAVRKWRVGIRIPRPKQVARILEVTNGQVTANDFVKNYSKGEIR